MEIALCVNLSEKNKIGKNLSSMNIFVGTLKEETSIINPVVLMELENPALYNYAYIPEFNRYYFITDMVAVRNGLWRVSMHVDVLESFKTSLMNIDVILSDSEIVGADNYLSGAVWRNKVKEKTDIISFPGGLSDTGYFILITAGG